MNINQIHTDTRLIGKYYCNIYMHGIPEPIGFTDDYDTEEGSLGAVKEMIRVFRLKVIKNYPNRLSHSLYDGTMNKYKEHPYAIRPVSSGGYYGIIFTSDGKDIIYKSKNHITEHNAC